ncbi:MAG: hypothetical protein ACP5OG_03425 [Candidatus Nanoarchaeia archaeon]
MKSTQSNKISNCKTPGCKNMAVNGNLCNKCKGEAIRNRVLSGASNNKR